MGSASGPVAFVLSGGATLGAAQAGMLEALLEEGIVPDLLVGTSVGAVNAAYLAVDPTADQARALSAIWLGLTPDEYFPLHPAQLTRALLSGALYSSEPLRRLLERQLPYRQVEEAPTPLRIVATRCEPRQDLLRLRALADGLDGRASQARVPIRLVAEKVERAADRAVVQFWISTLRRDARTEKVFDSGSVIDAVLASSALPLVFPPHRIDGQVYVDGGLSDYVPIRPALEHGARTIYVLSLGNARDRAGLVGTVRAQVLRRLSLTPTDVPDDRPDTRIVVLPAPRAAFGLRDFSHFGELVNQARDATRAFLRDTTLGRSA